ncbi:MAG: helicase-related protein [Syntrophales bacterium]
MDKKRFSSESTLVTLKDFQRRTVDYVFDRFYGQDPADRFLVADEVGLGKTLVAKGVIARAVEHLQDHHNRIDVIYICSNAAIASQNINRINVSQNGGFVSATRLTFLPTQVQRLSKNPINFISFTPGTTFDLKNRGGRLEERIILYRMLKDEPWARGTALINILQATVQSRVDWHRMIKESDAKLDKSLTKEFRKRLRDNHALNRRLIECCQQFKHFKKKKNILTEDNNERFQLIGELRYLLAETCIKALEPDLVIMDEFQRFKDLLDGEDEAALLAKSLFKTPGVKVLLLSATPYKMLTLDHEQDDDHYPDFIRTLKFLFDNDKDVAEIQEEIKKMKRCLYSLQDSDGEALLESRDKLQKKLLRHMTRTERIGMTQELNAMLTETAQPAPIEPRDLSQAALADSVAQAVGAGNIVEYWKSVPYLLNFLRDYDLRKRLEKFLQAPDAHLLETIKNGKDHLLRYRSLQTYARMEPENPRMRALFKDALDSELWRLLWMPPSLPYTTPTGHYTGIDAITKILVFSSWNAVPNAIASLCSYEAERRMLEGYGHDIRHDELHKRVAPLLRFRRDQDRDGRLTGMPVLALLMPFPILADSVDPLKIVLQTGTGRTLKLNKLLKIAEQICRDLLKTLPSGRPGVRVDRRWYWAAPAMLEAKSGFSDWCRQPAGWSIIGREEQVEDSAFAEHVRELANAISGDLSLGPRPKDLARVMAEIAVGGPGCCALRALRRVTDNVQIDDSDLLTAAIKIASGFRTLFNLPETIALLRGGKEASYWRLVLQYCEEGNLQAVLDEQVHMLLESLGLTEHPSTKRLADIAEKLSGVLSIVTARLKIDEFVPGKDQITRRDFTTRSRFAIRYGDLQGEQDSIVARADMVRETFNSPFRPFILASTSIGQEGLDFHTWCHAVMHWNLPSNPVDLEQREGRIHRYKGHAIRKNVAKRFGLKALESWDGSGDPWAYLFDQAVKTRPPGSSDLIPYWIYEVEGGAKIERRVPIIPFSKEEQILAHLKRCLVLYRLVFGQPRQEDLLNHLLERLPPEAAEKARQNWQISLLPCSIAHEALG